MVIEPTYGPWALFKVCCNRPACDHHHTPFNKYAKFYVVCPKCGAQIKTVTARYILERRTESFFFGLFKTTKWAPVGLEVLRD